MNADERESEDRKNRRTGFKEQSADYTDYADFRNTIAVDPATAVLESAESV